MSKERSDIKTNIMAETGNFSLVKFEGKPIEKLIEVIGQGIGILYRPTAIRKEAKAKAFEIEVLAKAKALAKAEDKFLEFDLANAIEQRLIHQQAKKQSNLDNIIDVAFDQINQENEVSSDKVDPDWTTRFFDIAEDISNADMQNLWGRILSGEIKQPGSYSLRTLDVLKNLKKEEAEVFTKFAQLQVKSMYLNFIPFNSREEIHKLFDIKQIDILLLTELGLINYANDLALISNGTNKPKVDFYENGDTGIFVKTSINNKYHSVKVLSFTKIGSELATLITYIPNPKYIDFVCKALSTPFNSITHGKILEKSNDEIQIENPIEYKNS